jgi:Flp pilus assembly pilin Flp
MKKVLARMWKEEDGVLSFEWVLLLTLLTIGIVGGVAAARDAIIDELGDVAQAMLALDQSYTIDFPLVITVHAPTTSSASDSSFTDAALYFDCDRVTAPIGQGPANRHRLVVANRSEEQLRVRPAPRGRADSTFPLGRAAP